MSLGYGGTRVEEFKIRSFWCVSYMSISWCGIRGRLHTIKNVRWFYYIILRSWKRGQKIMNMFFKYIIFDIQYVHHNIQWTCMWVHLWMAIICELRLAILFLLDFSTNLYGTQTCWMVVTSKKRSPAMQTDSLRDIGAANHSQDADRCNILCIFYM